MHCLSMQLTDVLDAGVGDVYPYVDCDLSPVTDAN